MKKGMISANAVTCMRIVATAALIFTEPLSECFFCFYTFAGITDVLDGFIARRTNTESDKGARLDSIADLMFYTVMIIRLFPVLYKVFPKKVWLAAGGAVFVRICSYVTAAIKYKKFASLHTYMNKLTGAAVFLVPYFIPTSFYTVYCFSVCAIGVLASTEELIVHIKSTTYNPDIKSVFYMNKQ